MEGKLGEEGSHEASVKEAENRVGVDIGVGVGVGLVNAARLMLKRWWDGKAVRLAARVGRWRGC